jgi:RNA polymerase sigma factor (sigma-70 family)
MREESGGGASFEAVYERERASIVRTVALIVGDAERGAEIAQEAFVRLHMKWRTVGGYDRPGAWVRRVAIRLAVKDRDRERRRPVGHVATEARSDDGADHGMDHGVDVDVRRALAELPKQQRAAIVLHYFVGLDTPAVADALGTSESTARVHLHRARHRLAELLREEVDDAAR